MTSVVQNGGKMKAVGTALQVYRGKAKKTVGGLTKKHLKKVDGRIVRVNASKTAKKRMRKQTPFAIFAACSKKMAKKNMKFDQIKKTMKQLSKKYKTMKSQNKSFPSMKKEMLSMC